jgi:hypothetical protein
MDPHVLVEIITACIAGAWVIVGLLINNKVSAVRQTQLQNKVDLLMDNMKTKTELIKYNSELKETVSTHIASDNRIFEEFFRRFDHQDDKMDKIFSKLDNLK